MAVRTSEGPNVQGTVSSTKLYPSAAPSQCKGKLTSTAISGPAYDVFAKVLRGLSGARLTRPGQFRSSDDSAAVRCSYKVVTGALNVPK